MLKALFLLSFLGLSQACDSKGGQTCIWVYNNCPFTIWPGVQGSGVTDNSGFRLDPYQSHNVMVPNGWSAGRIWARRGCDNNYNCDTGFCGNQLKCSGNGGEPPASLAEFTLSGWGGMDYYDVSMVDGYNLPIFIEPVEGTYATNGGNYDCKRAGGCVKDLNDPSICPAELQDIKHGQNVACKSACLAFNTDYYCCRGAYSTPDTCNSKNWPVNYPAIFKSACPKAYAYAYDDTTSTFTCRGNGSPSPVYKVQFC